MVPRGLRVSFETCRGYVVIARARTPCAAPAICRRLELARADGYAVVAIVDGSIVADADGWVNRRAIDAPDPFDLACERRHDGD